METIAYTVAGTTTEISFTALGVGLHPQVTFGTHGASKFTLPLPGVAPETAAVIPFEALCKIYTGRTGTAGAYSGGTILFQGRRTDNSGEVSGASVSSELTLEDAWYDLRFLTLQAVWQVITGGTVAVPVYSQTTWPDVVLFQAAPGITYTPAPFLSHITTGQAIAEMLEFAINFGGVNLQIGEIDPALYVPYYPVRSARVADALKYALRVHPDCTTEIDYTTTPPTFNVRQRTNLTALTLPYKGKLAAAGVTQTHLTSQVKPRPDLIPSRVGIYIKETASIAGQTVIALEGDIYPPSASISLRSFDTSIDMTGPKTSLTTGQVTSTAVAFNILPWWQLKVPAFTQPETVSGSVALVNPNINDGSLNCITVLDESGNPISLTQYPCVMENEGTINPWMTLPGGAPVISIKAIVTGYFTYQRQKNIGTAASPIWVINKQPALHPHPVRVHLTNSPAGTETYSLTQLLETGESYPVGLAQGIYTSLQQLQYQFSHTILEQPFTTLIKPGKHALNLTGGNTAWQTMQAMIQEVTIEFTNSPASGLTTAKTTIKCGPVEHLEPGQLVQLFNLFQNRDLNKINPNERTSGLPNGGVNAGMPSETAKENTTSAEQDDGQQMHTAVDSTTSAVNINGVNLDPANGQITMATYAPSNATPLATGLIAPEYRNAGPPAAGTLVVGINYRVGWRYVDTTANALWSCTTAGTNSTSVWAMISGGGGMNFRGYWLSTTSYNLNDMVVVAAGAGAGSYVSTTAGNVSNPATGGGWIQVGSGNQVGLWT